MPLNTTTYMVSQGWGGAGVPLDGAGGRGLKKPLAIPQRRGLKGLGKDRDRAVEWWDCLFEAGAKSLAIADPTNSSTPSGSSTPLRSPMAGSSNIPSSKPSSSLPYSPAVTPAAGSNLSLIARAKREHAKRALMSSFVRGRAHEQLAEETRKAEEELAKKVAEQDRLRKAVQAKMEAGAEDKVGEQEGSGAERKKRKRETKATTDASSSGVSASASALPPASSSSEGAEASSVDADKAARKAARKAKREASSSDDARKAEKRAQKAAKKLEKLAISSEEEERKSKRRKHSSEDGSEETKEQRRARKAAEREGKEAKKLAKAARKASKA